MVGVWNGGVEGGGFDEAGDKKLRRGCCTIKTGMSKTPANFGPLQPDAYYEYFHEENPNHLNGADVDNDFNL